MTTFKPAKRENVPLLIGLDGTTGTGKTLSALLLADGIASAIGEAKGREGRICFIDSERGRALHYAPAAGQSADPSRGTFDFAHTEIRPPFRPKTYGNAITAAEAHGADVTVIDSFSHEWEGEGGVKEWADEILAANPNMKSPAQWNIPKTGPDGHKRLVNQMLAARTHIIVCMRSEEKMRMEDVPQFNDDGSPKMWKGKQSKRTVITAAADLPLLERWVAICEKRFPFEITTSLLLTPDQPGVPHPRKLQDQHRPFFPEGQRITREAGAALARWSMGGAAAPENAPNGAAAQDYTIEAARADLEAAARGGQDDLRRLWSMRAMAPHREALQADLDRLKPIAAQNDKPQNDGDPI